MACDRTGLAVRWLGALALAAASAGGGELKSGEGWLALPVQSDRPVPRFEFQGRAGHELVVTGIKAGLQLILVKATADTYDLRKLNLGGNWYIEITGSREPPATVEVVAGAISYASDLELDAQGAATRFKFGGCSVDLLRGLARGERKLDAGVFDRFPVATSSKQCEQFIAGGPTSRPIAEWEAATGRVDREHDLAALNRVLARNGAAPVAFGQQADAIWKSFDALPRAKLRAYRDSESPAAIWVRLEGLWGWRGNGAMYHLVMRDGALVDAYLRGFVYDGANGAPDLDLRHDVEAYADGR